MASKTQTETDSPPKFAGFLSPNEEAGAVGDLMMAAQGAALLLLAAEGNVKGSEWDNVAIGISVVLASLSNQVDARYFGEIGISLQKDAIHPKHRLYLLEQQVAKVRAKIAEKGGNHG